MKFRLSGFHRRKLPWSLSIVSQLSQFISKSFCQKMYAKWPTRLLFNICTIVKFTLLTVNKEYWFGVKKGGTARLYSNDKIFYHLKLEMYKFYAVYISCALNEVLTHVWIACNDWISNYVPLHLTNENSRVIKSTLYQR